MTVARLDGDRLVRERTLTCVRVAISVDVMSPDTVYLGDRDSRIVHVGTKLSHFIIKGSLKIKDCETEGLLYMALMLKTGGLSPEV